MCNTIDNLPSERSVFCLTSSIVLTWLIYRLGQYYFIPSFTEIATTGSILPIGVGVRFILISILSYSLIGLTLCIGVGIFKPLKLFSEQGLVYSLIYGLLLGIIFGITGGIILNSFSETGFGLVTDITTSTLICLTILLICSSIGGLSAEFE